ncbi:hypothetical protein VQ643_13240 [Pseudomonas sp. F1_0610]|uniref:tetratricopeptide repeat protein n=1 Tax=Pseudomonas sp. F1_0610 TaxID=3114284 RepID=UPI0039C1AD54
MRFLLSGVAIIVLAVFLYFFQFHQNNALPLQAGYDLYEQENYLQAYEFFKQRAEHDAQAAFSLASMHLAEKAPQASQLEAEKWLIQAAQQGNKSALYDLGFLRFKAVLQDTSDDANGLASLKQAADLGATEAQLFLAGTYLTGDFNKIAPDIEQARRYFKQAEQTSDDPLAKFGLAIIAYKHDNDAVSATNIAKQILSDDFPMPAILLAQIYKEGAQGVEADAALAERYQKLAMKQLFSMSSSLEPSVLSIYGALNQEQKKQLLAYYEKASTQKGNSYARYALFNYYNNGKLVFPNPQKALTYIDPLVANEEPKALYLNYINTKENSQNLIKSADANYPDAAYRLSLIYSNKYIDLSIQYDEKLASSYLKKAADAKHTEALLDITKELNHSGLDNQSLEKYTLSLLENNPNNSLALMRASEVYANKNLSIYSLEKSFELNKKAASLNDHDHLKLELAKKYGFGIGTDQNLEKAMAIYTEILPTAKERYTDISSLIELYFTYDLTAYIDEEQIVSILEQEIKDDDYKNANYYANYLLKKDPINNKEKALALYKKASQQSRSGALAYANALLELTEDQDTAVALLVNLFTTKDRVTGSKLIETLSKKEQEQAHYLIFNVVNKHPKIKKIILEMSLSENNSEAKELVNTLVGKDPDITFLYAIQKISKIKDVNTFPEDELNEYYTLILKAAELGSTEAYEYITENLNKVTYINDKPYYKSKFQKLTGLKANDSLSIYEKCIKLGSDECLLRLGEIYQKGYYDTPINYEKALYYYNQIKNQDSIFVKSLVRETKEHQQGLIDLKAGAEKLDPTSLYNLAHAYQKGFYGLPKNTNQALNYLKLSATMGYEPALEELIDYYSEESRIQQNKQIILTYYNKLADLGSKNYTRELAHQYLQGSPLVAEDRAKAREYYTKALNWGDEFIEYMDAVDLSLSVANESTLAKYQLGNAYLHGRGIKQDVDQGLAYLELAAEAQHKWAIQKYADILLSGLYSSEQKRWLVEPSSLLEKTLTWMKKHPQRSYFAENIQQYESLLTHDQTNSAALYFELAKLAKNDKNLARYWYQKSINAGNYTAIQALANIADSSVDMQAYYHLGADNQDQYSQIQLALQALNNSDNSTLTTNYNTAVAQLEKALTSANKELSEVAFKELEQLYQQGIKNSQDIVLAAPDQTKYLTLLTKQAQHHPQALVALFNYYYKSEPEQALVYLQQAAEQDYTPAQELLFTQHLQSAYCKNPNANRAQADLLLTQLIAKNDPYLETAWHAQNMADNYMLDDCGLEPDYAKAVQWYKTYLELSPTDNVEQLPLALFKLGDTKQAYYYALIGKTYPLLTDIKAILSKEEQSQVEQKVAEYKQYRAVGQYADAIAEQAKEAEEGNGPIAFSLAVDYIRGDRVPQSEEKAIYYYELAGKNGYIRGYNVLGNMYLRKGPKQDTKKALYYFDLGAKAKDSNTAHLAGDLFYFGQSGIEKNYQTAAQYYEITDLEQGFHHAAAKYKIAYMYYNGLIGNKSQADLQKAYDYLQIAYKYGDKNAKNAVKNWSFSAIGK